jgi:hypothetical protein
MFSGASAENIKKFYLCVLGASAVSVFSTEEHNV